MSDEEERERLLIRIRDSQLRTAIFIAESAAALRWAQHDFSDGMHCLVKLYRGKA